MRVFRSKFNWKRKQLNISIRKIIQPPQDDKRKASVKRLGVVWVLFCSYSTKVISPVSHPKFQDIRIRSIIYFGRLYFSLSRNACLKCTHSQNQCMAMYARHENISSKWKKIHGLLIVLFSHSIIAHIVRCATSFDLQVATSRFVLSRNKT